MVTATRPRRHSRPVSRPIVTLSKGGTKQRDVCVDDIKVPDAWHLAMHLKKADAKHGEADCAMVLDIWHLCHDLLRHIKGE